MEGVFFFGKKKRKEIFGLILNQARAKQVGTNLGVLCTQLRGYYTLVLDQSLLNLSFIHASA